MAVTTFKFNIGQDVWVKPLDLKGRVFACCDRGGGIHEYRIIWWSDGKRNDEWLYEYELGEVV